MVYNKNVFNYELQIYVKFVNHFNFYKFATMSKLEKIYDGWKNVVFPSEAVEKIAKGRAAICSTCPNAKESFFLQAIGKVLTRVNSVKCNLCGCPISAKTRSVGEHCPDNPPKWN